jgi:mono/diheme cytochrome c family protein
MTIPVTFDSADARMRGAATFREHCVLCHGESGDGFGLRREGLASPPRDFTDPRWRQTTSPRRIFFAIREGLAPAAMPSWKTLSDDQIWDLTAYVWSLGEPR